MQNITYKYKKLFENTKADIVKQPQDSSRQKSGDMR